jgi:uncharacterized membrane protein
VFAQLRVWDTEENNGVLIYVQLADRDVEIVADRGFAKRVKRPNGRRCAVSWKSIFGPAAFKPARLPGSMPSATLLARHFPPGAPGASPSRNQLPDRPTLL